MRLVIALVALGPSLLARADASAPGETSRGAAVAPCGSSRRAQLARALADYCEHDRRAEARTCHCVRRALRCEPDAPSRIVDDINGRGWEMLLLLPERCKSWRAYFAHGPRGWRVDGLDDDPDCATSR
ncbi:MAG TPA: hypothetical protein VFF06_05810 [Polyangia bacterium]|nr:hypothetical protein [Polyangia bacterium]